MINPLRWRGHEVCRLEAFSDTVFAFALTLLVAALEVPRVTETPAGTHGRARAESDSSGRRGHGLVIGPFTATA
jgi:hypothetical protein